MAAVVFVVAMVMLGVAGALVVLRQSPKPPQPGTAAHRHLESPYQAMLFHKGQLHVPSQRGIGHANPRDLSRAYERAGYEWVSITDLNTLTPTNQFTTPNIVAVPGTQAAFPFAHLLELGVEIIPPADTLQKAVDDVHAQAGLAILARPKELPKVSVEQIKAIKGLDAIEILDARLARENPPVADATDMWDALLSQGRRIWGVVGDDSIDIEGPASTVGATSVNVQTPEVTVPLIADAIRRGAFYNSTGVRILSVETGPDSIRVITPDATAIKWYGNGGKLLATTSGATGTYRVRWDEKYVRAVASRADGAQAWTQPVFVIQ
jgi:hypothetical protein